jgi:hypothetical protein
MEERMNVVELIKNRREMAKGAPKIQEVVRGSIVIMNRVCGKATCRCQKGLKHSSMYVSQSYRGKTRMIYIPKRSQIAVRRFIGNYLKIKNVMNRMSEVNIKMLTKV